MNRILLTTSIFCFVFIGIFFHASESFSERKEAPEIYYFYSSHCEECSYLKENCFPLVKNEFGEKVKWNEINIDEDPKNLELAYKLVFKNRKLGTITPSIVVRDTVLMGTLQIESGIHKAITTTLSSFQPTQEEENTTIDPDTVFSNITPAIIIFSGLVDGINPCAFAAIAFLISILYVYAYRKKEIVVICLSYCIAVFVTYFLIGLGFFNILYSIRSFYKFTYIFRVAIAISCLLFALFSVYDSIVYRITGKSKDLILVLPDLLKKKISLLIGAGLRGNKDRGIIYLATVTFILGMVVSCMEMICTGQVYLPTLVYILKTSEHFSITALAYILLYNIMFVVPLLAVLALCLLGINSQFLNNFLKKNTGWLKLALALVFTGLGVGLLFF